MKPLNDASHVIAGGAQQFYILIFRDIATSLALRNDYVDAV
jgi:hypothetical protein